MNDQKLLPFDLAISSRDVAAWERRVSEIDSEIEKLVVEQQALMERIHFATHLFQLLKDETGSAPRHGRESKPSDAPRTLHITADSTFVDAVKQVVWAARPRIAPHEVKEFLSNSPLAQRLVESDKGFYHAIGRLAERGEIVRHNGWLFSPEGFSEHQRLVSEGLRADDKPIAPTRSPMGDAIQEFIDGHNGVTSKEVIVHLRKDDEFRAALTPNATIAYNIISRLIRRGQVKKKGSRLYKGDAGSAASHNPLEGVTLVPNLIGAELTKS